jgi:hypothetical protein
MQSESLYGVVGSVFSADADWASQAAHENTGGTVTVSGYSFEGGVPSLASGCRAPVTRQWR